MSSNRVVDIGQITSGPAAHALTASLSARRLSIQIWRWASRSKVVLLACWTLAALSWLLILNKAVAGGGGDAYFIWHGVQAFDSGHPMYFQSGVNGGTLPTFTYPPSAALILAPLGLISFSAAKVVLAVSQAIGISLACALSLHLAGRLQRLSLPMAVLAGSLMLPARNSVWLGNVDGVVVALQLAMLVAAARNRWGWAAIAFGLGLAMKPVLLPLALIFVLKRQWTMLLAAVAIPAVLSVFALTLSSDGPQFATKIVGFLWGGQSSYLQESNISLVRAAENMNLPAGMVVGLRLLGAAVIGALLIAYWRRSSVDTEAGTRLAVAASIIMLGVLLLFSYAWAHYILFLLPLVAVYGVPNSPVRGWLPLVAFYLLLFPDTSFWALLPHPIGQLRLTVGMLLLVVALVVAMVVEVRRTPLGGRVRSAV